MEKTRFLPSTFCLTYPFAATSYQAAAPGYLAHFSGDGSRVFMDFFPSQNKDVLIHYKNIDDFHLQRQMDKARIDVSKNCKKCKIKCKLYIIDR